MKRSFSDCFERLRGQAFLKVRQEDDSRTRPDEVQRLILKMREQTAHSQKYFVGAVKTGNPQSLLVTRASGGVSISSN